MCPCWLHWMTRKGPWANFYCVGFRRGRLEMLSALWLTRRYWVDICSVRASIPHLDGISDMFMTFVTKFLMLSAKNTEDWIANAIKADDVSGGGGTLLC